MVRAATAVRCVQVPRHGLPCDSRKRNNHLEVGQDEHIKADAANVAKIGPLQGGKQDARVQEEGHSHEEGGGGFCEGGSGWVAWPPEAKDDEDKRCQEW
jgi:hypothetical protein